jgi:uncharacterized protein
MRKLSLACLLLVGILVVLAQSPAIRVIAQEKPVSSKPKTPVHASTTDPPRNIDSSKEAVIRQLMEVTGAKSLGEQLMKAGLEQFRASITESQPDNPRAKQFVDAFQTKFQKHFDPNSLAERVVPIYDKYLSEEDVKGLLDYYNSPLGQRMLKALPEVARESQAVGFALGQKAAQEALEELKAEYPDFVSGTKPDEKNP